MSTTAGGYVQTRQQSSFNPVSIVWGAVELVTLFVRTLVNPDYVNQVAAPPSAAARPAGAGTAPRFGSLSTMAR